LDSSEVFGLVSLIEGFAHTGDRILPSTSIPIRARDELRLYWKTGDKVEKAEWIVGGRPLT
jgi:hypothetical protein